MPELPEVQTTVNGINAVAIGKTITDVWTDYGGKSHTGKGNIKDPAYFNTFKKSIIGSKITGASRIGKNVLIHLSGNHTILIHMKMTGHIMFGAYQLEPRSKSWVSKVDGPLKDPFNRFIHLVFSFSDGNNLVLSDMRKFAKVALLESHTLDESIHLKEIGPDPLSDSFDFPLFKERLLKKPQGNIKTVLMIPQIIAGVGNIYSDEALWLSSIHPEEKVKNISDAKLKKLHASVLEVLKKGIDFGGDSMSDYRNILGERGKFQGEHNAYRKTGSPCKRKGCNGEIIRKVVNTRSAHFCSVHQVLEK